MQTDCENSENKNCFYENGLHFECNACSFCCRFEGGVVRLSQKDLEKLSSWAGLTVQQFEKAFCRTVENNQGKIFLALREKQNHDCIFWKEGKGCEAYEARPVQCSTYPFWDCLLKSRENWDQEGKKCPGINQGKVWSKEEIENEAKKYHERIPLEKK